MSGATNTHHRCTAVPERHTLHVHAVQEDTAALEIDHAEWKADECAINVPRLDSNVGVVGASRYSSDS